MENDEEWQGDLSQTQIFTASSQAKKEDTDFPIGHFNTEEAAQKIKKAIGVRHFLFVLNRLISLSMMKLTSPSRLPQSATPIWLRMCLF